MSSVIDSIKADYRAVMDADDKSPIPESGSLGQELDPKECGHFVWPISGGEQEKRLQSRLEKLVLQQQNEESAEQHSNTQLEIEILQKFQANKTLDVVDDICVTIEEAFGLEAISETQGNTDQLVIHACYDLVDLICQNLMDDLGFIEQKPAGMITDFTVRSQVSS